MDPQGGIQYEEDGRPYILMPDGRKNYISPAAFGGQVPADNTGVFHKAPQWNQYSGKFETPFDWGNLATMLTAGGLTAGLGSAFLGGGAAAAGAGGAEAAGEGGAAGLGAAAAEGGAGAGGILGSTVTAPLAGSLPAGGVGLGAAGAGAAGAGAAETGGLYAQGTGPGMVAGNGLKAAGAVSPLMRAGRALAASAPIVGALTSGNRGQLPPLGTGFQDFLKNNPQYNNLLNNQVETSNRSNDLHKALVGLSTRLLPNSARGNY